MSLVLHWVTNSRASSLYAAATVAQGQPLADARLATALREPVAALAARLAAACGPTHNAWRHLTPLAATSKTPADLVQVSLNLETGQVRPPDEVAELAGLITKVEQAILNISPQLADELPLRARPLVEQWEARGPGLWRQLALLSPGRTLPEAATVLLVQPAGGGGGASYKPHNTVALEAVLANPHAHLPEVLRLAWLLAQLGGEGRSPSPCEALALIPVVLAAAEPVELVAPGALRLEQVLEAWWPELGGRKMIGQHLHDWWQAVAASTITWPLRLAQLRERLPGSLNFNHNATCN